MSAGIRSDATKIKELVALQLERANLGDVSIGSRLQVGNTMDTVPDILVSRGGEQPYEHEHGVSVISQLEIVVTAFVKSGDDIENEVERLIQGIDNALTADIRLDDQVIQILLLGFSEPRIHALDNNQGVASFDGRYRALYQYSAGNR